MQGLLCVGAEILKHTRCLSPPTLLDIAHKEVMSDGTTLI